MKLYRTTSQNIALLYMQRQAHSRISDEPDIVSEAEIASRNGANAGPRALLDLAEVEAAKGTVSDQRESNASAKK